jgi:hypothetical protein
VVVLSLRLMIMPISPRRSQPMIMSYVLDDTGWASKWNAFRRRNVLLIDLLNTGSRKGLKNIPFKVLVGVNWPVFTHCTPIVFIFLIVINFDSLSWEIYIKYDADTGSTISQWSEQMIFLIENELHYLQPTTNSVVGWDVFDSFGLLKLKDNN